MSLNWKEIDLILSELPLKGSLVRNIYQPDHHSLILELYSRRGNYLLYISLLTGFTRLHTIKKKPKNPSRPPRFVSFLRAHIRNGKISGAEQLGLERVIKITVERYEEKTILWIRLWGGAANIIAADEKGNILDAFYRRPKKGEVSGGLFAPEAAFPIDKTTKKTDKKEFTIRDIPGEGNFNERIEKYYSSIETGREKQQLITSIIQILTGRENRILSTIEKLEKRKERYENYSRYRELGDIIKSSLHKIKKGDEWLNTEDFFNNNEAVDIRLDKKLSPLENAGKYYKEYKKAKSGLNKIGEELESLHNSLRRLKEIRKIVEDASTGMHELYEIKHEFKTAKVQRAGAGTEGITFYSHDFTIKVGRSAKENDALLRHYARGNDYWFHVRDYPGGYVFVRNKAGKSIPLEVMLDAAHLAMYYSKRKTSGQGDIYYTQVKYLRRAKAGKTGLVIPTQEKNLFVKYNPERIRRLKEMPVQ